MKALIFAVTLFFSALSFSGEVTGAGQALRVLSQNQMSVESLKNQGLKVLLGEVTGAGKTLNLDRIQMLVSDKKVFPMNEVSHIEYVHPSQAKALRDVKHLEFNNQTLKVQQIKGVIYE